MLLCSPMKKTCMYSHEEKFIFPINSQNIPYISSDAPALLQGNPKDSFCYLGCLSKEHLPNDCPRHFSSSPMEAETSLSSEQLHMTTWP